MAKTQVKKLSPFALAISIGIVWGAGTLLMGWFASLGWGMAYVELLASIYMGYKASFIGGIIGGIWGFFDAAIGGFVFAYLYNVIAARLKV